MLVIAVATSFCAPSFGVEIIDAPTIDPTAPQVVQDSSTIKYTPTPEIGQEEVYNGKELEIPNLIDVLKPKLKFGKNKKAQEAEQSANAQENEKPKNSITLESKEVEYFEDRNEVEARGGVVIKTHPDNTTLSADKAIFNRDSNVIKLFGNVVLQKDDATIAGDFMNIDLNEENVLMNEPVGTLGLMTIRAQEGYAYANEIQTINGEAEMAKKIETYLQSKGFGYYDTTIVQRDLATPDLKKKRSEPLKIKTREIIIESKKEHDTITFKDVEIYYKKFKIATAGSAEILTDKSQSYVETNLPEVGMIRDFGTYVGWGFATETPLGGTLKVIPALVYDSGVGFGLIGRYRSKRNMIEAAYATSSENLILRGEYNVNDNVRIDYGRHAYFSEWFFGRRRPGYLAQISYDKSYNNEDLKLRYRHVFSGGYVTDWAKEESENKFGTARLRWQAEVAKSLFEVKNDEQEMFLRLSSYAQVGATVYGTGDTVGVVRFGPSIHSRVKNWGSRISYGVAGVHGESPLMFDKYVYGKQYLSIDENLRLCRFLSVGYQGTISILRDNIDKDLLTENKFYVIAGPDDLKLSFAYDAYRERFFFDVLFLMGGDSSKIKYDKLTVKNPDKQGKKTSLFDNFKYYRVEVPETL